MIMEEIIQPKNLSECFEQLDSIMSDADDADWFKNADEQEAVIKSHHGLGRWIRNNWGLWTQDSRLHEYFKNLGLTHPDDMSSVILTSYHRHLNNVELNLEEQIQHFIDFWEKEKKD